MGIRPYKNRISREQKVFFDCISGVTLYGQLQLQFSYNNAQKRNRKKTIFSLLCRDQTLHEGSGLWNTAVAQFVQRPGLLLILTSVTARSFSHIKIKLFYSVSLTWIEPMTFVTLVGFSDH